MKLPIASLIVIGATNESNYPPGHPVRRLEQLNQDVEHHLTTWFSWLPSQQAWIEKFKANGDRMIESFDRCGTLLARKKRSVDSDEDTEEIVDVESPYDEFNPSQGMAVLVNGYRNWAERYLSNCAGQIKHNHQEQRMGKWDTILHNHLENAGLIIAGWKVLNDVQCPGYDLHRFDSTHVTTNLDACIKQCQHDNECNAVTWLPQRGNQCWKKKSRCLNAQPVSEVLWRWPDLEGAVSAYKFHTGEDGSVYANETDPIPNDWIIMKETDCLGPSLEQPRPTPSLNACIDQCNEDDYCNTVVWVPQRNNFCYKKSYRCHERHILDSDSHILSRWPDMEGALSGYKHFTQEDNFSVYSTFDMSSVDTSKLPNRWQVLDSTMCLSHDLHRTEFMKPASSINECIAQCRHDQKCNAVSWIPQRGGECWRKDSRCMNAQPVSDIIWKWPDLEGTISAYEFHTPTDEIFYEDALTPADWIVLKDTDCYGGDIKPQKPALSIFECIEQCNQDDYCNTVTWVPKRNNLCYKKSNRCSTAAPNSLIFWRWPDMDGAMSAYKHYTDEDKYSVYSKFDLNSEIPSQTPANWIVMNDVSCGGHDLHRLEFMQAASNINECIAQCRLDQKCNAVTWIPLRDGQCWRKNSRCFNPQPVSELLDRSPDMEGTISAYEFHTAEDEVFYNDDQTPTDWVVLKDTDCFGADIRPQLPAATMNDCIEQCNNDDRCNTVTWVPMRNNRCYKKTNRCSNAAPASEIFWRWPDMDGAMSAYKHIDGFSQTE